MTQFLASSPRGPLGTHGNHRQPTVKLGVKKARAKGKPVGRPVVVDKVEWHQGELFPRVGFIVTNMSAGPEGLVDF